MSFKEWYLLPRKPKHPTNQSICIRKSENKTWTVLCLWDPEKGHASQLVIAFCLGTAEQLGEMLQRGACGLLNTPGDERGVAKQQGPDP